MGTHVTSIIAVGFEDSGFAPGTDALSGTIENMHQRRLALRQRVVLVVALGAVLWVFGDWVIEQSSPGIGTGWTSYAPLSVFSGMLAATLFAHEPAAFGEHDSAGLYDHGGPLAASMSTISPG
jgi:hypothetical protein